MSAMERMRALPSPSRTTAGEVDEIQLSELWRIIRRHQWLVLATLVLAGGLATAYALLATPIYEASVTIRIDDKQTNIPALDILKSLSSAGNQVNTEMQVLQTRALAEDAVDSLALQVGLLAPDRVPRAEIVSVVGVGNGARSGEYSFTRTSDGRFSVRDDSLDRSLGVAEIGRPIVLEGVTVTLTQGASQEKAVRLRVFGREEVIADFAKRLKVTRPDREANVVVVTFRSSDQRLVRDVPNFLARRFILDRQVIQQTEARSTVKFLKEQIDTLGIQLVASENALKRFREGARIVSLDAEAGAAVKRVADIQAQRYELDAERGALVQLLAEVNAAETRRKPEEPSPYRRLIAFPTLLRNPAATALLTSLASLDDQRAALLTRRTVNDPDVQALTQRTRDIEEQIRTIAVTYTQGLTNQVAGTDATLATLGQELSQVPAKEIEFARLARSPKILEEIYTLLQTRLKEAQIAQAVEDASVRVVDAAVMPVKPVAPKKRLIVILGLMGGLMAGVAFAFLREHMDHTIHTREEIQALTGVAVLGLIPHIPGGPDAPSLPASIGKRLGFGRLMSPPTRRAPPALRAPAVPARYGERLITASDPASPVSESYRALRTNITFARPDTPVHVIAFTSAMPSEGKTTSSANLAITLAQQGLRVLLIDADMRRGTLNDAFSFQREPGLSNVLLGYVALEQAVRRVELPAGVGLDFLATGTLPPNPAELLGSERMGKVLNELRGRYDMVIIDTPPTNLVTDAAIVGSVVDGVVVVARAAITRADSLSYAMDLLHQVHAPVLGVLLNDINVKRDVRYSGNGGYYYYAPYQLSADVARL